jgi:hypothetical protein
MQFWGEEIGAAEGEVFLIPARDTTSENPK